MLDHEFLPETARRNEDGLEQHHCSQRCLNHESLER
jgi:hypothetical protein